jgi:hypothetical protein
MAAPHDHPLTKLGEEDLNMVAAFVLVSGSIKDLAQEYGVSYPTMRIRLNALIERLRGHLDGQEIDPLNDYLAELIANGQLSVTAARAIRELHGSALRRTGESHCDGETSHA